jgi:glycosyltransferase involved in cell wall biosynthesis
MSTTAAAPATPLREGTPQFLGERLVYLIGAFRSGTTLLRKILDSHPRLTSPAETWFLLPLLDLWRGTGTGAGGFNPAQAAAALRGHLDRHAFLRACRAFSGEFYRSAGAGDGARIFIDKTPLYLSIAGELALLLPEARFLILARDPRGILWSRATWRHSRQRDPARFVEEVAHDVARLAAFYRAHGPRCHLVRYERLCREPETAVRAITHWLDVPFVPSMLEYGAHAHHEGYGDEETLRHAAAHDASVARWAGGLDAGIERDLLAACGGSDLALLGYDELAERAGAPAAPARASAPDPGTAASAAMSPPDAAPDQASAAALPAVGRRRGERVLFLSHPGTNSRDILLDMARGFRDAGCDVARWELEAIGQMVSARPAEAAAALTDATRLLRSYLKANDVHLSVGMWAGALSAVVHAQRQGKVISFFDVVESPHLAFWLDAPHWAAQGGFHHLFGSSLAGSRFCFHLINNAATGAEMAQVLGFSNVIPQHYGVDVERFRPHATQRRYDLVFALGAGVPPPAPLALRELESDDPDLEAVRREAAGGAGRRLDELAASAEPARREGVRHLLRLLLDAQLADPHRPMLQRLAALVQRQSDLGPAFGWLVGRPADYVKACAIARSVEGCRRAFTFTHLSRHFRCASFGGGALEGWGCRAEHLGEVGYEQQAAIYSMAPVGLNVMRWQDDTGLNLKPFEIAASGAACLCERRGGVEECFEPGREILLFDGPGAARRLLADLLAAPAELQAVAEAGLARVRRDHTWAARARQLMAAVGAATGRW